MTWLQQRQPGEGVVLLRDYPGEAVRIECRTCGRAGRYRLATLMERYGPAAGLPHLLSVLSADCPRRQDWRTHGPCGAGFLDLVPGPPT